MLIQDLYNVFCKYPSVKTDTRTIQDNDLFFALKGANFNGNHFAKQALDAGAAFVITDEEVGFTDSRIIRTEDVLTTLQQLAKYHRQQFTKKHYGKDVPFLAITGSNGKTTTKELVNAVLSSVYTTYTTKGNLNNHIGIPLTLLSVKGDAEIAVIEMGANHQKEIEDYCRYALPTHGMITNCGKAHLEGFGGEDGVKKGKGELFDYLRNNNGTAFIFKDYPYLTEMSKGIEKIISYGTGNAEISGVAEIGKEFLEVRFTNGISINHISTQLVGDYNLPNVLAAVAIGKYFNVPDEKIKLAIENYTPGNSRSQLIHKNSNKIILDAYNANPSSMKVAIENFSKMEGTNKILMLGGMMELGESSIEEHNAVIQLIAKYKWEHVVLVGNDFNKIKHPYFQFNNSSEAKEWMLKHNFHDKMILIKGSRSMQMEKVLD